MGQSAMWRRSQENCGHTRYGIGGESERSRLTPRCLLEHLGRECTFTERGEAGGGHGGEWGCVLNILNVRCQGGNWVVECGAWGEV